MPKTLEEERDEILNGDIDRCKTFLAGMAKYGRKSHRHSEIVELRSKTLFVHAEIESHLEGALMDRFGVMVYFLVEKLSFAQKLQVCKDLFLIDKPLAEKMKGLNTLRNKLTHPARMSEEQLVTHFLSPGALIKAYKDLCLIEMDSLEYFTKKNEDLKG